MGLFWRVDGVTCVRVLQALSAGSAALRELGPRHSPAAPWPWPVTYRQLLPCLMRKRRPGHGCRVRVIGVLCPGLFFLFLAFFYELPSAEQAGAPRLGFKTTSN